MRKIFALLLSLLLVVSVMTGCGASKKTSNDGGTKVSASIGNSLLLDRDGGLCPPFSTASLYLS